MRHVAWTVPLTCTLLAAGCGENFDDAPVPGAAANAGSGGGQGGTGGPSADASDANQPETPVDSGPSDDGSSDGGDSDGGTDAGSCPSGYGDCDEDLSNGCETPLDTTENCGACGKACSADQQCMNDLCQLSCGTGTGDCDEDPATGCETDTTLTVDHCGACGNACASDNGTADCVDSSCAIECDSGWGDCDDDVSNGCEVQTATDTAHCGACGNECPVAAHASAVCIAGSCELPCDAGWGDCDGNSANGCETDLTNSGNHCGECSKTCAGQQQCLNSICQLSCSGSMGDCDSDPANGCETNLTSTPAHCSACGQACPAGGHGTATCANSVCGINCSTGWANCDSGLSNGCEVNLASDASNCGECGTACPTGTHGTPTCINSVCDLICATGWGDCDGALATGCEVNTEQTVNHCGYCGNACPTPAHATAKCVGGTCGYTCVSGWGDCNGLVSDGCEANLGTSTSHCGSCGTVCGSAHGTPTCSGGSCSIACASGYADCDGVNSNGCEANLSTDPDNCGACGHDCQSGICSSGLCGAWVLATEAATPVNIALSSTHVYWVTASSVRRVAKAGGAVETVVSGFTSLRGVGTSSTHVYFSDLGTSTGSIRRAPLTGSTSEAFVSTVASPLTLAIQGTTAFWSHSSGVDSKPMAGGSVTTIAQTSAAAISIAVDGEYVFYVLGGLQGSVGRDSVSSVQNAATLVQGLKLPSQLAIDDTYVYVTVNGDDVVKRVPKAGGTATQFATADGPVGILVDDQHAFVAAELGKQILQIPKAGGSAVVRKSNASSPTIIVGDSTRVYWIERDSSQIVMMVK